MTPSTSEAARQGDLTTNSQADIESLPDAPVFAPATLREFPDKVFYGAALAAQSRAHRRFRAARDANAEHEPKDRLRPSDSTVLHAIFALTTTKSSVVNDNVHLRGLMALTGLSRDAVRRGLRRLAFHGVIVWRPHEGRAWSRRGELGGGRNGLLSVLTRAEFDAYRANPLSMRKGDTCPPIRRTEPTLPSRGENVDVLRAREAKTAGLALTGGPLEDRSPSRPQHDRNTVQALSTYAAPPAGVPARPSCRCADDLHATCPKCYAHTLERRVAAGL